MLIKLLIILLGGWWKVKQRCLSERFLLIKRAYIFIHNAGQFISSSSIAWNSNIDSQPFLPHGMSGIFISGEAKIGRDCVIFQQVTIGSNTLIDSKSVGAPIIGDKCYIGAGAKIIGSVKVGNNVRIGANCVVYKDVPDNCVVVSGEQKNIQKERPLNNRMYAYHGRWMYFENGKLTEETSQEILDKLAKFKCSDS